MSNHSTVLLLAVPQPHPTGACMTDQTNNTFDGVSRMGSHTIGLLYTNQLEKGRITGDGGSTYAETP